MDDDRWNGLILCLSSLSRGSSGPDISCLFSVQLSVGMHCSKVNLAVCNIGSLLPSSGVFLPSIWEKKKTHDAGCKPLFHSVII